MTPTFDISKGRAEFDKFLAMSLSVTRKSAAECVESNFRGVVRWLYSVTPPMGGKKASVATLPKVRRDGTVTNTYSVDFSSGKNAGERTIKRDVGRILRAIPDEFKAAMRTKKGQALVLERFGKDATSENLNASPSEVRDYYLSRLDRNKKVRGRFRRPTWASTIKAIIAEQLKTQGITPAGWVEASESMRAGAIPSWIRRNASVNKGTLTKIQSTEALIFEAKNNSNHPDSARIQSSLNSAFQMQANTMARSLAVYLRNK
jgi:hypothetical protein